MLYKLWLNNWIKLYIFCLAFVRDSPKMTRCTTSRARLWYGQGGATSVL